MEAKELKATASLPVLLQRLGHTPARQTEREFYYFSMLSGNTIKPLLAVNPEHNIWYDHTLSKGGNIIDFAMAYWKLTSIKAINRLCDYFPREQMPPNGRLQTRRRHAHKLPYYRLEAVKPLGNSPEIANYLQSKYVWEAAQTLLSEVYYYVEDEKRNRRSFFAAGWQNELGHWQVCSENFNDCLNYKAITFISQSTMTIAVFQDCMNYLSWKTENPDSTHSILILNNIDLLQSAIRKIRDFLEIQVYFDRDDTGRLKSAELIQALPQAIDRSGIYKEYMHYNEMLVKRKKRTLIKRQ